MLPTLGVARYTMAVVYAARIEDVYYCRAAAAAQAIACFVQNVNVAVISALVMSVFGRIHK